MRNRIIIGVTILILLSIGLLAFKNYAAPGGIPTSGQAPTPTKAAELGVVTAAGQVVPAQHASLAFKVGGRIVAIPVRAGDSVKQGMVLARLEDSIVQKQIAQAVAQLATAQAQLAQADAQVQLAEKQLAQLKAGGTDSAIASAQAALSAANANYDKVKQGPTADQLGGLKASVDSAKAALDQAQAAYDRAGGTTNPFIVLTRESLQLQQATNAYNAALAAYNDARSHPTASDLAAAYSQIQQAQDALARLSPTQPALDVAQAQVDAAQATRAVAQGELNSAQAALDLANAQAPDYVLVAPFDGTIAAKSIDLGQVVQAGAPAFDLGDLSQLQVETTDLSEVDVTQVAVGQRVNVTFDGLPGKTFTGKVVSVAPEANDHRGDQVYKVTIDLPDAVNGGPRWGMTANVSIQVSQ
jgi:multidrug efflux pump subunit AcrA (membrane-fusion protein)